MTYDFSARGELSLSLVDEVFGYCGTPVIWYITALGVAIVATCVAHQLLLGRSMIRQIRLCVLAYCIWLVAPALPVCCRLPAHLDSSVPWGGRLDIMTHAWLLHGARFVVPAESFVSRTLQTESV